MPERASATTATANEQRGAWNLSWSEEVWGIFRGRRHILRPHVRVVNRTSIVRQSTREVNSWGRRDRRFGVDIEGGQVFQDRVRPASGSSGRSSPSG